MKDCVSSLHIGFRIPTLWASSLMLSISVNLKKEGLTYGTKHSLMVTREKLQCFIPFSQMKIALIRSLFNVLTSRRLGQIMANLTRENLAEREDRNNEPPLDTNREKTMHQLDAELDNVPGVQKKPCLSQRCH